MLPTLVNEPSIVKMLREALDGAGADASPEVLEREDVRHAIDQAAAIVMDNGAYVPFSHLLPGLMSVGGEVLDRRALPARLYYALARNDVHTWGQLAQMSPTDLLDIRNLGTVYLRAAATAAVGRVLAFALDPEASGPLAGGGPAVGAGPSGSASQSLPEELAELGWRLLRLAGMHRPVASGEHERADFRGEDFHEGWTPASFEGSHPTVLVEHDGREALIDEELGPIVLELWRAGIATLGCCQDEGEGLSEHMEDEHPEDRLRREYVSRRAYIWFATLRDQLAFYDTVANGGPRDQFYARMTQRAALGAWQVDVDLRDTFSRPDDCYGWDGPSRFTTLGGRVSFPRADIPEILERLRRHARGERGPHGPPIQEYALEREE